MYIQTLTSIHDSSLICSTRTADNNLLTKKSFTDDSSFLRHAEDDIISFPANEWDQCHDYDSFAKNEEISLQTTKLIFQSDITNTQQNLLA